MDGKRSVVVLGLGEIGRPILELFSHEYEALGVDVSPVGQVKNVDFLHVCYPFEIEDFVGETARYIERYKPALTIINSTVAIGTTRTIAEKTGTPVVNSPVRGKHVCMLDELRRYTKFIGALDVKAGEQAAQHFQSVGVTTKLLFPAEATELAKLTETTYFGLLIAWAQEVERYCDQVGANYDEVVSFYEQIQYLPPVKYFPGVIGGHCVMPNIEILLNRFRRSEILKAIEISNRMKAERTAASEAAECVTAGKGGGR